MITSSYTNDHGNFQIRFQTCIFEIICIFHNYFHRLMFVYTTSNVYLPPGLNIEVKLLLIQGLK